MSNDYRCRVCGLQQPDPPWGIDGVTPSFLICDCCGIEFGYEDATIAGTRVARASWLARGAPWFVPHARPMGWESDAQLKMVPAQFT